MSSRVVQRAVVAAPLLFAFACEATPEDVSSSIDSSVQALSGLSVSQLGRFHAGATEFSEVETAAEGLGPLFNATSCAQCHNMPRVGGASLTRVLRAACPDGASDAYTLVQAFSTRPEIA